MVYVFVDVCYWGIVWAPAFVATVVAVMFYVPETQRLGL
jgi:hypothetical protein